MKKKISFISSSKYVIRTISIVVTIIFTVSILSFLTRLLERKESVIKNHDFFEEDQDLDILFLGTSHVINGIYPLELWNEYGYTSYNLGNHSTPIATSYWILLNALDYTNPKLVVLDCLGWQDNNKLPEEFAYAHKAFDCFPLSMNKVRAIKDLTEDQDISLSGELLWDFTSYHNRWNQLTADDFNIPYNYQRGAEWRVDVAVPVEYEIIPRNQLYEEETTGKLYVEKIIEECQKRDIDVLLTWLPYPPFRPSAQEAAHSMEQLAKEYGINSIDFFDMNVVNYDTDMYDESSHLNPSGALKVTNYIGEYIKKNYEIADHRTEDGYESWSADTNRYFEFKRDNIIYETDPVIYLMLINDDDFDVTITWNDYDCLDNPRYSSLFNNLGLNTKKTRNSKSAYISGKYLDRSATYLSNAAEEFDANYDLSVLVTDVKTGEQFDNIWFYYADGETPTITHIYK